MLIHSHLHFPLQFPTISRKTMMVFDCIDFGAGDRKIWLLRSDPTLQCYSSEWSKWAVLAACGAVAYCIGFPFASWRVSRQLHTGSSSSKRLVKMLTHSYTERCWYMESVDLMRKFILTGMITLVGPQTKVQLWFGQVVSLIFLLLHLRLEPFRDPTCNVVQLAVHVQLVFTYMTSSVSYTHLTLPTKRIV